MFHYVYVLQSEQDKCLYVGYSRDLKGRISEHNSGLNFSTKHSRPWKLIFAELYLDGNDAKRRERYLKTSQGARLLKRMIKEYFFKTKKE